MRERSHEMWIGQWFEDMLRDIRVGARGLARNAGFTVVAVLTLALGIGANTAIFSVIKAVLLEPLPYQRSDRIVQLIQTIPATLSISGKPRQTPSMNFEELFELQKLSKTLAPIAVYDARREMTL